MSAFVEAGSGIRMPLSLRLALRELRGAKRGFGVFLACLVIGVMSLAGIGSFVRALSEGLEREGRAILGGDAAFSLVQREADAGEMAFLESAGDVARVASLRAMARSDRGEAALAEVKAVDDLYPLAGALELDPPMPVADALAERDGMFGAAAEEALFVRLGVKVGDVIRLGEAPLQLRAVIRTEPDKLSSGLGFGARLLVSDAVLASSALIKPGSLVRWSYRLLLPDPSEGTLTQVMEEAKDRLGPGGYEMRSRSAASPQLERNLRRLAQYLTLVGLTALLVGGVGVANAVASHLSAKTQVIATLKAVGARRAHVFAIYGIEVALIAMLGIALGLVLGAALPFIVAGVAGTLIPIPLAPRIDPLALALAALYGALVTFAFTLWPLARAQEAPVSRLFRDGTGGARRPPLIYAMAAGLAILALSSIAVLTAPDPRPALAFVAAAALVFGLLRLVALAIMALARRAPRPRSTVARLALANIHRPGALTPTVVLSLGLGLSLMTAIALIDGSLRHEIRGPMAEEAPSFFFVDVPSTQDDLFRRFVAAKAPSGELRTVPMLRGRITALAGRPAEEARPAPEAAWVLQSDRGLTYSATPPEGSHLVAGQWWGPDETAPLVSFDAKLAEGLGLKLGDSVTVNVLGRSITAHIANLREVKWERLGINFVMVFSPNAFAGAPHTVLATLTLPGGGEAAGEMALVRDVAARFPEVTTVRVKEALAQADKMVADLSFGIRLASLVTLMTSILVLAGALAAGHQHRVYDAVILKTLGATRGRLIVAYGLEYALIGLATALFALIAGTLAAYGVVTFVMDISFAFSLAAVLLVVAAALLFTVGFGLVGTWRALSRAPAEVLRHL